MPKRDELCEGGSRAVYPVQEGSAPRVHSEIAAQLYSQGLRPAPGERPHRGPMPHARPSPGRHRDVRDVCVVAPYLATAPMQAR